MFAAIRLKQIDPELQVAVLEKGSEVGAHILSGAVLDPSGLDRLIPDRRERGAPLNTAVNCDDFYILGESGQIRVPNCPMPPLMNNHGNYIVSMGNVCRWLANRPRNWASRSFVICQPSNDPRIGKELADIATRHGQMQIVDAIGILDRFDLCLEDGQFPFHARDLLAERGWCCAPFPFLTAAS